jgi:hypothetical protein
VPSAYRPWLSAARGTFVLALLGEPEPAAVLWGAVTEGVLARRGALPLNETSDHDRLVAAVQLELGDHRYTAVTARGSAMTYEQITTFALAAVEDPDRTNSRPRPHKRHVKPCSGGLTSPPADCLPLAAQRSELEV